MEIENYPGEKPGKLSISNKILIRLLAGLVAAFIIVLFLIENSLFREEPYEIITSILIFYLLASISLIIYKELRFRMVSAGMLLMAMSYFCDAFEELAVFKEEGIVDRMKDVSRDYIMLTGVVVMFFRFVFFL